MGEADQPHPEIRRRGSHPSLRSLIGTRIERLPNLSAQFFRGKRLLQICRLRERLRIQERAIRIARHEYHSNFRKPLSDVLRELRTSHVGHQHVAEKHLDRLRRIIGGTNCLSGCSCFQYRKARLSQHSRHQLSNSVIILDQEDCLTSRGCR